MGEIKDMLINKTVEANEEANYCYCSLNLVKGQVQGPAHGSGQPPVSIQAGWGMKGSRAAWPRRT